MSYECWLFSSCLDHFNVSHCNLQYEVASKYLRLIERRKLGKVSYSVNARLCVVIKRFESRHTSFKSVLEAGGGCGGGYGFTTTKQNVTVPMKSSVSFCKIGIVKSLIRLSRRDFPAEIPDLASGFQAWRLQFPRDDHLYWQQGPSTIFGKLV
jgi:hypothetical protein